MSERAGFAWVLNLDAELELARPSFKGHSPPARLLAQLAEYGVGARALCGPRDVLLTDTAEPLGARVGRAWCPTPGALSALSARGVEPEPHPAPEVLRRVNHRLFAHELGGGLPEQRFLRERAAVDELLARAERPWLLKRPLAFAGRGQLRAYKPLTPKEQSWLDASLRSDGLLIEPLVTPTLELSLHGFIWRDGSCELGRPCVQEVTTRGVFRAVRLADPGELDDNERRLLETSAGRVASALTHAGYFGPFGIDAYRYQSEQERGFCALGEINARYTMGFVTGFPRHPSELELS